jgi:hypothetical protein
MKTLSQLTEVYYKTLYPVLEKLDKERKSIKNRVILVGVILLVVVVILLKSFNLITTLQNPQPLLFAAFGYFMVMGIVYSYMTKDYKKEFKQNIIKPLIELLDENLTYVANGHIDATLFQRSKLFSRVDRFGGDDYVYGDIDGVKFEFSDVVAKERHIDKDGHKHYNTIFQGLFIVAEFNKNFNGITTVLPDSAQNLFGDLIGSWLQSNNMGRDELVKMDSNEFEKEFVVYSTDQIEARYILSHTMMDKLLELKKRSKEDIYVSFVGNYIHIGIEYNKDLFEPSVFHSLLEYKIAMEYVQTLHLAIGVVRELKLNQKLWSKR